MRNPFRRKHNHHVLTLKQVDHFTCGPNTEKGGQFGHVINSFQYGSHPQRVYDHCPFCEEFAILSWKDTKGRLINRLQFTVTYIYGTALAFGALGLIAYVIYRTLFP